MVAASLVFSRLPRPLRWSAHQVSNHPDLAHLDSYRLQQGPRADQWNAQIPRHRALTASR